MEWLKRNLINIIVFLLLIFIFLLIGQGSIIEFNARLTNWLNTYILDTLKNFLYQIPWILIIPLYVIIMLFKWRIETPELISLRLHFLARKPAQWIGRIIKWLKSDWRPPILFLVLAAILVAFLTYGAAMYNISFEGKSSSNNNAMPLADSPNENLKISSNNIVKEAGKSIEGSFTGRPDSSAKNAPTTPKSINDGLDENKNRPADDDTSATRNSIEDQSSIAQKNTPLYNGTFRFMQWWTPNDSTASSASPSSLWTIILSLSIVADHFINTILQNWWKILLLWIFLYFLRLAWATHKKLIINEFKDESNNSVKLINQLLALKLTDISDIYSKANETREVLTSTGLDRPLQAQIYIEELDFSTKIAAMIKTNEDAYGWLSSIKSSIDTFIKTILDPPQIKGTLYKNKDFDGQETQILIAYIYGGDWPQNSWKVSKKIDPNDDPKIENSPSDKAKLDKEKLQGSSSQENIPGETDKIQEQNLPSYSKMTVNEEQINEMAYRIFTDLVFNPTRRDLVRWKATSSFYEGLTAYRASLRSRLNKKLRLIEAERKFLETLAEDESFNFIYYNLGVIYSELENWEAARIAFLKSIDKDPDQWEAYYALGLNLFYTIQRSDVICNRNNNCEEIIKLCQHAISLEIKEKEKEAKVYDLIGLAQRFRDMADNNHNKNDLMRKQINLKDSIQSHKKAVSLSYWALYYAERKAKDATEIKRIIIKCLQDLATDYYYQDYNKDLNEETFMRSEILLKEAISILPSDADLHVRLGQIYRNQEIHDKEVKEFEIAWSIDPNRFDLLCNLPMAYLGNEDIDKYIKTRDLCLDSLPIDCDNVEIAKKITDFYHHGPNDSEKKNYLELFIKQKNFLKNLEQEIKEGKISLEDLNWKLEHEVIKEPIDYAIAALYLKRSYLKNDDAKTLRSKRHCEKAVEKIRLEPEEMKIYCYECIEKIDDKSQNEKPDMILDEKQKQKLKPKDASVERIVYKNMNEKIKIIENTEEIVNDAIQKARNGDEIQARSRLIESIDFLNNIEKNELIHGDICLLLGDLYLNSGSNKDAKKAEHYYKSAIDSMKGHPLKLVDMELQTNVSKALRYQSRLSEAQKNAEDSIISDPLDYLDRGVLGRVFADLKDFKNARIEWETSLLLNPDDSISRFNIGATYILEAQDYPVNESHEYFELAAKHLQDALILFNSEDSNYKIRAHYWLGIAYEKIEQNDQAISQLKASKKLSEKSKPQPNELIIGLALSKLYIDNNMHEYGEVELKEIIEKSKNLLEYYKIETLCGSALGLAASIGYIIIKAYLNLCYLYAMQAVAYTEYPASTLPLSGVNLYIKNQNRLDMALDLAYCAKNYIEELRSVKAPQMEDEKDVEVKECEGILLDCYGWIAYKMGVLGKSEKKEYPEIRIDEAILLLEASVSKNPSPRALVHLAVACKKKIEFLNKRIEEIDDEIETESNTCPTPANGDQESEPESSASKKKGPLSNQEIKSKPKLTISQKLLKGVLNAQKMQREFCIRHCYDYVKSIENKMQYSNDHPNEYIKELEELKKYVADLDSKNPEIKPPQEKPNSDEASN